jgi:hypothetical protein
MGGFVDSSTGQPVIVPDITKNPLYEYDLLIRQDGTFPRAVAIREEEILDRSKGNTFVKLVVVLQTLWFVTQYLARWIDHLPRTQLEVVTLAYATLTVAVYCFWWYKPLDVYLPIAVSKVHDPLSSVHDPLLTVSDPPSTVPDPPSAVPGPPSTAHFPPSTAHYPPLKASYPQSMSIHPGVGLFDYDGLPKPTKEIRLMSFIIIAVVATIFGAIHCFAWDFPFPTSMERLLWRICATFVTAIPVPFCLIGYRDGFEHVPTITELREKGVVGVTLVFCTLCYVVSRGILFVITFLALRSSPPGTYQTIPWSSFIPHFG